MSTTLKNKQLCYFQQIKEKPLKVWEVKSLKQLYFLKLIKAIMSLYKIFSQSN